MSKSLRIWIDLANSPHVPFFRALIPEFVARGHEVEITARNFAQTVELARTAGLNPAVIGEHGGRNLIGKVAKLVARVAGLMRWTRGKRFDLTISHNAHEHLVAARLLRIPSVTLMDYEHHPANHLSFRLASRVIVPEVFPAAALRRFGVSEKRVRRYHGWKEDVYLADFTPDPAFPEALGSLGVEAKDVLVLARPPALEALYHRFENELFDELLVHLSSRMDVKIILLLRSENQRAKYERLKAPNVIMPAKVLDGSNLIAAADLVISAGGTMNREAAALGVPTASIFAGKWAAIDEELVNQGRLRHIKSRDQIQSLVAQKKQRISPRAATGVRAEVADLILE